MYLDNQHGNVTFKKEPKKCQWKCAQCWIGRVTFSEGTGDGDGEMGWNLIDPVSVSKAADKAIPAIIQAAGANTSIRRTCTPSIAPLVKYSRVCRCHDRSWSTWHVLSYKLRWLKNVFNHMNLMVKMCKGTKSHHHPWEVDWSDHV